MKKNEFNKEIEIITKQKYVLKAKLSFRNEGEIRKFPNKS